MREFTSGRTRIYTDVKEINMDNVISVLQNALIEHMSNAAMFDFLQRYEEGNQPLQRKKTYRADIDVFNCMNLANQITEFKCGFHFGNPITLIQNRDRNNEDAITELNDLFDADNNFAKTQEIGRYCEIGGYGIEYIDYNRQYEEGKAYWTSIPLNPQFAFIVYSGYYADHRKMMGVSYREINDNKYFTCITENARFEIENLQTIVNGKVDEDKEIWKHGNRSGELNPIGKIPFVEWLRNNDRMGCFERQVPMMDSLNIMCSDFVNDVDQNTQCIWHGNDIELAVDEEGNEIKPKNGDWLFTYTPRDGKTPFAKPLSVAYDYNGILNNINTTKATILEASYVPCRNDNSGGSTGIAMSDATGWSGAEMIAAKQQALIEKSKMDEVEIVLAIIKTSLDVPADSDLKKLTLADVKANVKRQKTYELTSKTNAMCAMLNAGIYGEDAIKTINLFDDPNEVWLHSKDVIIKKQQDSTSTDVETGMQDESDQIQNSPSLDGMRTSNEETKDSEERQ